MTNELFVQISTLLFIILWMVISAYVLPYFKSRMSATELEQLTWFIRYAVRCAEQIYTPEEWKRKKEYVMAKAVYFVNNTLKIDISAADIDTIVEGIVNEIKRG